MKQVKKFTSDEGSPEAPTFEYYTNGLQGGDAGHGGVDTLCIQICQGAHQIKVADHDGTELLRTEIDDVGTVILQACGDWEQSGLAFAIIDLGEKLKSDPEIRQRWVSELRWRADAEAAERSTF